ncbi:MAG: 50S ribosomal protein L6 [Clostridiales bacterium]|nr:50S ribosomal protein L6 [Clostridiales bacterium]MBQ2816842.1 50S ribosomal protein L6 [Clostridia bacterium]
MSRIGKLPVAIPAGVSVKLGEGNTLTVKGPKGELTRSFNMEMNIKEENGTIVVTRPSDNKEHRALHGLTRTLINNMVVGVSEGFSKTLDMVGTGYRASVKGQELVIEIGYSHPVIFKMENGITFETPTQTQIVVKGVSKEAVGQIAANIREVRPPEPYLGKGIRYHDEYVARKEGKAGKK